VLIGAPAVLAAARDEDVEALTRLERLCFSHPWTARHFRDALRDQERARLLVLRAPLHEGIGMRGLIGYGVFRLVLDELEVHNIAVHPELRNRGIGRWLVERMLELGARRGARTALLEARQSNWAALQLYRSLGFEAVSIRRDYYEAPREDAVLLRRVILEIPEGAC